MMLRCLLFLFCVLQVCVAAPLATRMVDLTHFFDNNTLYFPSMKKFELNVTFSGYIDVGDNKTIWTQFEHYTSSIHVGTHMDAPLDFNKDGLTIDEIPISQFIAPAAVVDITEQAERDRDYQVTVEDLIDWETTTGQKLNEVILLMRSGWSKRWHSRELFTGSANVLPPDTINAVELHSPGLHPDAAQWLVDNRNVYGVGSETLSLDYGPSQDFASHVILMRHNIFGFENVANLEELPLYGATLYAMPSKIRGATGAPVRLIATFPVLVFKR